MESIKRRTEQTYVLFVLKVFERQVLLSQGDTYCKRLIYSDWEGSTPGGEIRSGTHTDSMTSAPQTGNGPSVIKMTAEASRISGRAGLRAETNASHVL